MRNIALHVRQLIICLFAIGPFFSLNGADFTWIGNTDDLTLNTNWSPVGTPASGDNALFDGSMALSLTPEVVTPDTFEVLNVQFVGTPAHFIFDINGQNSGTPAAFNVGSGGIGGGVFLSTANPQAFDIQGGAAMNFINTSSADANHNGNLTYSVFSDMAGLQNTLLFNHSNAGAATIFCLGGIVPSSLVRFESGSSAELSSISILSNGTLEFSQSSAENAAINVDGNGSTVSFISNSTATTSTLIGTSESTIGFFTGSSLADAVVHLFNSTLTFDSSSSVSTAAITLASNSTMEVDQDLAISSLNADASSTIVITDSTLAFGDATAMTVAADIIGPNGSLEKRGSGPATLTGTNSYTGSTAIEEGTLIVSVSNLPPNGNITNNNGTLSFVQTTDATFLGQIVAGTGVILKTGFGTLVFNNDNSGFSGSTKVLQGQLRLNNRLGGNVLVDQTGFLSGTSQILGNLVVNGGKVSPGNSIGRLDVGGTYQQGPSGTYEVEVDGNGNSDLLYIAGTASLGGTLLIRSIDGVVDSSLVYTILHAEGGVASVFSTVLSLNPLLVPHVTYLPNDVQLTVQHLFSALSETHNQIEVAGQLQSITTPTPEEQAILTQLTLLAMSPATVDAARKALSQMSGEQYTNGLFAAEISGRQFIRRLYSPLRSRMTQDLDDDCYYHTCESDGCYYLVGDPWKPDTSYSVGPWLEIGGGHSLLPHNHDASGFSMNNYQISLGFQSMPSDSWTLGCAGSYEYSRIHYNLGGANNNHAGLFGLYTLYRPACYYVLGDLICNFGYGKVKRPIPVGTISLKARGNPSYVQGMLYLEAGKDFAFDHFLLQPFIGIEAAYYASRKFSEHSASPLDLRIQSKCKASAHSRLGLHLFSDPLCGWSLNMDIAWQCRLTSTTNHVRENFKDFGDSFTIYGVLLPRNSLEAAANLSTTLCDDWVLFAEISGEKWSRGSAYNLLGGVQYTW